MPDDREMWKVPETHHGGDPETLRAMRPLRGRALVEVEPERPSSILWSPTATGRKDRGAHFGRVLALGEPARDPSGVEQPWGCAVGDRVIYVYGVALERVRRFEGDLLVVAQEELQAVVTSGHECRCKDLLGPPLETLHRRCEACRESDPEGRTVAS